MQKVQFDTVIPITIELFLQANKIRLHELHSYKLYKLSYKNRIADENS